MKIFRPLLPVLLILIAVAWCVQTPIWKKTKALYLPKMQFSYPLNNPVKEKYRQKAVEAKNFTKQKNLNTSICFLIDMSLPSGQNRFFIYNLTKDSIESSGLVTHGNCFEYWLEGRRYSNVVGSGCTSLGKYKVGKSYIGKWGYSYKLYGLDSTNSNAFRRTVVLHGHSCVPDTEVADEICQSNGCPTISPSFLNRLKRIINNADKSLLLWIFD